MLMAADDGGGAVVAVVAVVAGGGVVAGGASGPGRAVSGGVVSVAWGPGANTEVGADEALPEPLDVVVAMDVVVVDGNVPAAAAGPRELVVDALTALWESPPQAPNPRAATTTSAVTYRIFDVPTVVLYGPRARRDCDQSVQSSIG